MEQRGAECRAFANPQKAPVPMLISLFDAMFQFLRSETFFVGVLWTGLVAVTVALLALMRTRWGQARPIRKCLILSLIAHLLFVGYAATVQIGVTYESFSEPMVAQVEIMTESDFPEPPPERKKVAGENPDPPPWEAFAQTDEPSVVPEEREAPRTQPTPELNQRAEASPEEPMLPPNPSAKRPVPPAEAGDRSVAESRARTSSAHPAAAHPDANRMVAHKTPSPRLPAPPEDSAEQTSLAASAPSRPPAEVRLERRIDPLPTDETLAPREPSPSFEVARERIRPAGEGAPIDRMTDDSRLAPIQPPPAALVPIRPRIASARFAAVRAKPELLQPFASTVGPPKSPGSTVDAVSVPAVYQMRFQENRLEATRARGATEETEQAVADALSWLAFNQESDGRWSPKRHGGGREGKVDGSDREMAGIHADTGVTGLALLAFLGTGNTQHSGIYRENVAAGIDYLIRSQAPNGNLRGDAGTYAGMYCHAMASLALAEAAVLSGDERLQQPLRRAVDYTLLAQDRRTGGWRYYPGDTGDTSQLGWQVLLLKNAEAAGIDIPEKTRQGAIRFLRSVSSGPNGGLASYRPNMRPTLSMTAEAMVCREFLGMPAASPTAREAAEHLMTGLPDRGEMNLYYWYYATLGLHQLQNDHWRRWNTVLQEVLLDAQQSDGPFAGSWDPVGKWGCYGGRVYSTAMGALCLEVYYRYQPLKEVKPDRVARTPGQSKHQQQ